MIVTLTDREQQVLEKLCKGMTSKEVALELNLSEYTITDHRSSLLKKLNAKTSVELGVKAMLYQLL